MKYIKGVLLGLMATLIISCGDESREELSRELEVRQFTFEADVRPILQDRCVECHPSTDAIPLVNFDDVSRQAQLISESIRGVNGAIQMPLNGSRLAQVQIQTIDAWILGGLTEK